MKFSGFWSGRRAGWARRALGVLVSVGCVGAMCTLWVGEPFAADSISDVKVASSRAAGSATAAATPVIDVSPTMFTGKTVAAGAKDSVAVTISNLGNEPLTYHMMVAPDDAGMTHVRVQGAPNHMSMIPPLGPPHIVYISYDATGLPVAAARMWKVFVTSNDPANDPGDGGTPIEILLHVMVTPPDTCAACSVANCGLSLADARLTVCPAGDEAFSVYLRNAANQPVVGSTNVWLDFSGCPSVIPCPSETNWPLVYPTAPTAADGRAVFLVNAGGCNDGCLVEVRSSCGLIATVPFKSFDTDGNLAVSPQDFVPHLCSDWDGSGDVRDFDLALFTPHISHNCASDARKQIRPTITVSPDAGVKAGDQVQVKVEIRNHTDASVVIDSVVIYQSGYDLAAPRTRLPMQPASVDANLSSGGSTEVTTNYVVPPTIGASAAAQAQPLECINAEIYTSASNAPVECEHCEMVVRPTCTPDTAFEFRYYVPVIPVYFWPWIFMPTGFTADVDPDVHLQFTQPDSVNASVTIDPPTATLGDSGRIFMLFCEDASCFQEVEQRIFRAIYLHQRGDVNDDCAITSADVIYLVNYIFKSGPEPVPYPEIGNIDCLGAITTGDIVTLVNFIFRGGPPLLGDCP